MPVQYTAATADLGILEGRLTAARAAALDELLAANIPADLDDVQTLVNLPGRMWEGYTPNLVMVNDNDANWVTVVNITGRGIIVTIGVIMDGMNPIDVEINIDGGGAVEYTDFLGDAHGTDAQDNMAVFIAFDTSLLIRMKGTGVFAGHYRVAALVE